MIYSAHTVFTCFYLTQKNSEFCPIEHKLTGFYNPDGKCLQRGTD